MNRPPNILSTLPYNITKTYAFPSKLRRIKKSDLFTITVHKNKSTIGRLGLFSLKGAKKNHILSIGLKSSKYERGVIAGATAENIQ